MTDCLALLRADWLFGALGILAVLATCVVIAALFYAGQDVRITTAHRRIDRALFPDGQSDRVPARQRARPNRRVWLGAGSSTERHILYHLQYGPLTRLQLDDLLDVRTSGQILPRMVERGSVRVVPDTWPYRYEAVAASTGGLTVVPLAKGRAS